MADSNILVAIIASAPGLLMSGVTYAMGVRNGKNTFIAAVQDAAKEVIDELRKDKIELKQDLAVAKELNERCEAGHDDCKRDLAEVRKQIDRLILEGPVANYTMGG